MGITRRTCLSALAASTLAAPIALGAAGGHGDGPFSTLAAPLQTNAPGKIEVIEFLWYGCPHCAKVEPFVEAWEKSLPSDVVFRREHIVWDARRETLVHARMFVTLRTLGLLAAHQQAVFDAVQRDRLDFGNEQAAADWAAKRGIDRSRFESMHKSFGMQSQLARLKSLTSVYRIEEVPTFIVNGKYATEPHRAGGERQVLEVVDGLVARERAAAKR